jgi:hypothetical protein
LLAQGVLVSGRIAVDFSLGPDVDGERFLAVWQSLANFATAQVSLGKPIRQQLKLVRKLHFPQKNPCRRKFFYAK